MKITDSRVHRTGLACLLSSLLLLVPGAAAAQQRPPNSLYRRAQIGDQMTGEDGRGDMGPVYRFEHLTGKGLALIEFASPFAECGSRGCTFIKFPTTPLE